MPIKTVSLPIYSLLLGGILLVLIGCSPTQKGDQANDTGILPEVSIITVKAERLPLTTELAGRLTAVRIAQVRARVAGVLQQQVMQGGSEVKAGDVLFRIDPAPLQASYHSAKANLEKALANETVAKSKAQRYQPLVKVNAVSKLDYLSVLSAAKQATAEVAAAKAAVQTAQLNLDYATVRAPINGRLGTPQVTEGALVGQNDATLLATLQQIDPIYLDLSQSGTDLLKLRQAFVAGRLQSLKPGTAKVTLLLDDGSSYPLPGKLLFSDITVDPSTGMASLRAEFPNPERLLLPGMYARARLEQAIDSHALTIPQRAVQHGPGGIATVLVVGTDNKVEERPITTTATVGDKWIVNKGLQAGERLIVEGFQKVKPGAVVKAVPFIAEPSTVQPAAKQV